MNNKYQPIDEWKREAAPAILSERERSKRFRAQRNGLRWLWVLSFLAVFFATLLVMFLLIPIG